MQINVVYDQDVSTLPAGFTTAVASVVQYFQSQFTDSITFNLHVGFGEVHGTTVSAGFPSANDAFYNSKTYLYSQIRNTLASDASSQDDVTAIRSLPDSWTSQAAFTVTDVQAVALGLTSPVSPVDTYIGFSSSPNTYDFDRSDGITSGQYDFYGLVAHELSAVMGRVSLIDRNWNHDSILDLYRYAEPGTPSFQFNNKQVLFSQGYFSIDAGATNLNWFDNSGAGTGSHADWASGGNGHVISGTDAFQTPNTGAVLPITEVDLRELDVIGYDRAGTQSIPQDHAELVSNNYFNSDGKSDILWRYDDGTVGTWDVDDHQVLSTFNFGQVGNQLQILATGDFNGDGKSDILWRDRDGSLGTWIVDDHQIISQFSFGQADNHWHVVGTGDFNGDGVDDVLWRHTDGSVGTWDMNAHGAPSTFNFGVVDNGWHIVGTGDFNGDGKADILWRNDDGSVATWDMDDHQVLSRFNFGSFDMKWQVAGTGDFNGDGKDDILWRHDDGSVGIWYMADHQILSTINFGQFDNRWHIAGTGDFNGDGVSDILWRNDDGSVGTWDMADHQILSTFNFGQFDTRWHIA